MMIENKMFPEAEGAVAPELSIWQITEHNQSLCFENHELASNIMLLLNGQPMTPPPIPAIPEGAEMNIKALLMSQTEIMLSMQRLLKQLVQQMYR